MTIGFVNELIQEKFTVIDFANDPVTGLVDGDFTKYLYNPSGTEVSATVPITITEMGNGDYTSSYTPNVKGEWYMKILHPLYFSWGKAGNIQVFERNFDNLALESTSQYIITLINTYLPVIQNETNKIPSVLALLGDLQTCSTDNRELILQLRQGNVKRTLYVANVQNNTRKVAVGRLDREVFEIKNDSDLDWSSPVSTKTLWCWYENLGDVNPMMIGEDG